MKTGNILGRGRKGSFCTVDKELVAWAYGQRQKKPVMETAYRGVTAATANFVPCEADCGKKLFLGEQALVVTGPGKQQVFCDETCQRSRHVEAKVTREVQNDIPLN